MSPLLTPAQMAGIQSLGVLGMTADVTIHEIIENLGLDDADPYGSKSTHTTAGSSVKGWLVGRWVQEQRGIGAGDVDTTTPYRLRLPVGTSVVPGWEVHIQGNRYLVIDVGDDQTWPEWLNVTLRRSK